MPRLSTSTVVPSVALLAVLTTGADRAPPAPVAPLPDDEPQPDTAATVATANAAKPHRFRPETVGASHLSGGRGGRAAGRCHEDGDPHRSRRCLAGRPGGTHSRRGHAAGGTTRCGTGLSRLPGRQRLERGSLGAAGGHQ